MEESLHKHLRRLERVLLNSPVYFVTICTHQRQRILGNKAVAGILTDEWRNAHQRHGWLVGRYVIMPDHVHFFCTAEHVAKTLSEFVRLWKQWTAKRVVAAVGDYSLSGPSPQGPPRLPSAAITRIWQRSFLIMCCSQARATRRSGSTFGRILLDVAWSNDRRNGPSKGKFILLNFCSCAC